VGSALPCSSLLASSRCSGDDRLHRRAVVLRLDVGPRVDYRRVSEVLVSSTSLGTSQEKDRRAASMIRRLDGSFVGWVHPYERFWQMFDIVESGCWIWKNRPLHTGYARFHRILAHRWSFIYFFGPLPMHLDVCHTCDVRNCVNPRHLFLGTRAENMQDASRKKRVKFPAPLRGKENPKAKLSDADILALRCHPREGLTEFVRSLGISYTHAKRVRRGKVWKHV
jgi:hypothetical protein